MTVRHSRGSYEVSPVSQAELLERLGGDLRVITDENVAELFPVPYPMALVLPPGESTKSFESLGRCLQWLARSGASRRTTVAAVGGGVVGDLGGFAAACYMRGVPYVQVPTTLLAQVDSSVGGKVGIDLPEGKNLAGAFYPPSEVLICTEMLATLPIRQFRNGMAEVLKYGFIMDAPLLSIVKDESYDLAELVFRCIGLKARVVEQDEYETTGLRAILNFGHTIGHALEQVTEYGPLLHGEAISVGMVAEARLGERLGISQKGTTEAVSETLSKWELPLTHTALKMEAPMLRAMLRDKKVRSGKLAFSLLTQIGACKLVEEVPEADVTAVLREL